MADDAPAPPPARAKRPLPLWKKLAFSGGMTLLGLLLLLCLLELALYLQYAYLPFDGRRGADRYTWGHKVVNNRLGFRQRDFQTPKPQGVCRIMVLGDSLTWGAGLAEQQRYSDRLEALLRRRHGGRPIEVLNFGVSGGPTTQERDILREHVDAVDPDLVVVGFCLNDPQPRGQDYSVERERYKVLYEVVRRIGHLGFRRSSALFYKRLSGALENAGLVPAWQVSLQRAYEPESPEWRDFVQALADVRAICDRRRLPPPVFALLNQGTSATRPTDYGRPDAELQLYLRWYARAEEAARAAGMVAVDFTEEFARELTDEPLAVNALDTHPSARCNAVYARKLAEVVDPLLAPALIGRAERRLH